MLSERFRTELPESHGRAFSRWVCIRSRFTEDLVKEAVAGGVEQYVILGAGLDSFAWRRPDLLRATRVYEIDQPQTLAWKRHRSAELAHAVPSDGVEHGIVLANGVRAADGESGVRLRTLRHQCGQIAPQMAALAEEHRYDRDALCATCG